jgi:S1-C subfamily serine protease
MRVDWQVYSRLDRKVVYMTSTEGSYQAKSVVRDQQTTIFTNAFAVAVQNLLADRGFHEIVARSPGMVVTSAAQPIRLQAKGVPSQELLQKRISEIKPAVVTIYAGSGFGSGFFISEDGYALTNAHVVGDAKFVKVKLLSGREVVGEVIRSDRRRDVALVKTEEAKMVALPIRSTEASVGEDVYAIGSPLDPAMSGSLTRGVLSGYRVIEGQKVIQSDVRVLPGNSGGPLLDQNGSVIGMAVSGEAFGGVPVGLNYFVPIADAQLALSVE